jgi:hypothetical protein
LSPQAILISDWLISKKSSPLKPFGQMNRSLVGSIYGRFSIKIALFFLISKTNMATRGNSTRFWFIWLSSFRGEDFKEIDQPETRIACGGHVC